jgi:hypothetical protein
MHVSEETIKMYIPVKKESKRLKSTDSKENRYGENEQRR